MEKASILQQSYLFIEPKKILLVLLGPIIFLVTLSMPVFGPYEARIGFGILFWMVYWWVTLAVDIKVTCLVPIIVAAFYPYMPPDQVMQAYVHKHAFLIFGATAVTAAWIRWGFAKRIALKFLLLIGTNSVQRQTVAWFIFSGLLSFIMGNTPVAAVLAPIAVAALFYAGFDTTEKRWNSPAASNILIAVAWGASIGGMATPLGGGQAVVTLSFLEKYIGHEVFFIDWAARMIPVSIFVMIGVALFLYFFMKSDLKNFNGSTDYYRQELKDMGPLKFEEKILMYGFGLIVLLALTRPMYVDLIKGPYFKWLHPSPLFFIFALLLFIMPARSEKGESILSSSTLTKYFPVAVLFIWPAAVALGRILNKTGANDVFAAWMTPFIGGNELTTISAFTIGPNLLSQMTSDTAAAGVVIPMVIESFKNWQGMEFGAVAFVWISGAALSWSYAIASSTGAQGIVAGYGANLRRMLVYGLIAAAISILLTILYFYITISLFKMDLYLLPPSS